MQKQDRLHPRLGLTEFRAGPGDTGLKGQMAWTGELEALESWEVTESQMKSECVPAKKILRAGEMLSH